MCKLLGQEEIKPHKVRYYLERRDAEFEPKMAEVLCVYREVQVLEKAAAKAEKSNKLVAIVSYDEKPGIQAIATTAPGFAASARRRHASFARDHGVSKRLHGTLSLLAGIDLLTGKVHALVRESHRSREFIEFLKLLDAAYPASTPIKQILDNHSAHITRGNLFRSSALKIVKDIVGLSGEFVFPGGKPGRPLSAKALAKALRRMKVKNATVHGFRSAFRDWAAECTNFTNEVCEAALAHVIENKAEAAYRRGDLFEYGTTASVMHKNFPPIWWNPFSKATHFHRKE